MIDIAQVCMPTRVSRCSVSVFFNPYNHHSARSCDQGFFVTVRASTAYLEMKMTKV